MHEATQTAPVSPTPADQRNSATTTDPAAAITPVAIEVARQLTITTTNGVRVVEHLPYWAEVDPSKANVPANRLQLHVGDIHHYRAYDGQTVKVDIPGFDKDRYTDDSEILQPTMRCLPHSEDPTDRVPVVVVEAVEGSDTWLGPFDPAGLVDLAAKLRAQADRLDDVAAELIDARADWAKHGAPAAQA